MSRVEVRADARRSLVTGLGVVLSAALAATLFLAPGDPRPGTDRVRLEAASNPITPGDFTGHGFDQCQAPKQSAMDSWMTSSPFLAVGIYIAGASRGCRNQTYLNATWVRTQLAKGWKLLPITLGPQASCNPRFPRYGDDSTINPDPANSYYRARMQGRRQATWSVNAATKLGIVPGSTLFYDLEGFDFDNTRCRESALWFLNGWTSVVHKHHYKSGVYSSAASGIKALDNARVYRPGHFPQLPDQLWIADWDGKANTSSAYVRSDGWQPHKRAKQYRGGHNETWGGVTINIDRDWVDLGRGSYAAKVTHCGGVNVTFDHYYPVKPPTKNSKPNPSVVKALKCLLKERGSFGGKLTGDYGSGLMHAIKDWQRKHHMYVNPIFGRKNWMSLHATNAHPVLKLGSAGERVRDLQRALDAVDVRLHLPVTGVFNAATRDALADYQASLGWKRTGIAQSWTWNALLKGKYGGPLT
ncbi:glycoside hydrolase domain-containing protein [Nocardioides cheoyonin]|uniref:glycoside hydrolase domain-containing protein n=1 Tax=Nocardioides cheoyonin TaxID=3156615 RepID=UPI0032B31259